MDSLNEYPTDPWVNGTVELDERWTGDYPDSYRSCADFNAAPYLLSTKMTAERLDQLAELYERGKGAGGENYVGYGDPVNDAAHFAAQYDAEVQAVFDSQNDSQGYSVVIDWDELVACVKTHRPELIQQSKYFRYCV